MADIDQLSGRLEHLITNTEKWGKSNDMLTKSISGLNASVNALKQPFSSLENQITTFSNSLSIYNKTVLEGSRNLQTLQVSLKDYESTLSNINKTTRLSKQEAAGLFNTFTNALKGNRNIGAMKEYVKVINDMGMDSQEATGMVNSLASAQNKLGDVMERMKSGKISAAELLALGPQDARNVELISKQMSGGLESSKTPMADYNKSMQMMKKNLTDVALTFEQNLAPVVQNIATLISKITPIINSVSNAFGAVFGSSIAATGVALGVLGTFMMKSITTATRLYGAYSQLPKIMDSVAMSQNRLAKSTTIETNAERDKIGVAQKHGTALRGVGSAADSTADITDKLTESTNDYNDGTGPTRRKARAKAILDSKRNRFRGVRAGAIKASRGLMGAMGPVGKVIGKGTGFLGKGIGGALRGGVAGLIASLGVDALKDASATKGASDANQNTAWKGLDIASSGLQGAGMGALAGSIFGPAGMAAGAAIGGAGGAAYGIYQNTVGRKKAELEEKRKQDEFTSLEQSGFGNKGVSGIISGYEKQAEAQLSKTKTLKEEQTIILSKLNKQKDVYDELRVKAEEAGNAEKTEEYAKKVEEISSKIREQSNEEIFISQQIEKQNELIQTQAGLFGAAANAAGEMANLYSDFYFDAEKAEESLKEQSKQLTKQIPALEQRARLAEKSFKAAEEERRNAKGELAIEAAKSRLAAAAAEQQKLGVELAKKRQEIERTDFKILVEKLRVEQSLIQVKLSQTQASEELAKNSMLGIGFSADAAKNTYLETVNMAKNAQEQENKYANRVRELTAQKASLEMEAKSLQLGGNDNEAQVKINAARAKGEELSAATVLRDKAGIETTQKASEAMNKLNNLREGYLDSLQEMAFGVGEVSLLPTQESGLATMSSGAARFGGKGTGRTSPGASINALGAWTNAEQGTATAGGMKIVGVEQYFKSVGIDPLKASNNLASDLIANSSQRQATAAGNLAAAQWQQMAGMTTVNVYPSSNSVSVEKVDNSSNPALVNQF